MGLDAGFELRHKDTNKEVCSYDLCYFRKYYALDDWIRWNCEELVEDYLFAVTKEDLQDLYADIEPVVEKLIKFKYEDIMENFNRELSFSEQVAFEEIYNCRFSPMVDKSFNSAEKLLRLYYFLQNILWQMDMLEKEYNLVYYSSY